MRRRSHSPQPTDYLGRGDTLAPLNKPHCVHLKYSATQWRTPVMETIGLNNLEQYFTIIYTMSFPSHRLYCSFIIVQNPKPHPLCYREFCWFPFKLWLMSQTYKKSWRLVGCIFKKCVKMAVISPVTLFCPKLPYEKFKTIKKNVRLKINMAISGLQPGPATLVLKR